MATLTKDETVAAVDAAIESTITLLRASDAGQSRPDALKLICRRTIRNSIQWKARQRVEPYPATLGAALNQLGLTSLLCLDAADPASYPGTGQSWLDRSGNGYDFFRGADGSATSTDPSFVGPAGSRSAYWSHDGGDYFAYDSAAETWMNNLHKDNGSGTFLLAVKLASNAAAYGLMGTTSQATSSTGVLWRAVSPGGLMSLIVGNGSGSAFAGSADASTVAVPAGAWSIAAISFDEAAGAGGSFFFRNGVSETFNATYTSPSASAASNNLKIAAGGNASIIVPAGTQTAFAAAFSPALSLGAVNSIWNAIRWRFGYPIRTTNLDERTALVDALLETALQAILTANDSVSRPEVLRLLAMRAAKAPNQWQTKVVAA